MGGGVFGSTRRGENEQPGRLPQTTDDQRESAAELKRRRQSLLLATDCG